MAKTKKRKRSAPAHTARRKTTRRRSRRRGGLSSGAGMHTLMVNGFKHTIEAGVGGYASVLANKWLPANQSKMWRVITMFGGGLLGTYFGRPVAAAGFVGGMVAQVFPTGLNDDDDQNYANRNSLSDMPLFLDEDGQPMVLEEGEDGSSGYRYLSESEVAYLEEEGAFDDYEEV